MPVKKACIRTGVSRFLIRITQSEKLVMGRGGESDVARRESEQVICYVLIFFYCTYFPTCNNIFFSLIIK